MPRISRIELLTPREQPILSIQAKTKVKDLPLIITQSYAKMFAYLQELGEQLADVPFVAYHNWDMQNLQVEMGFPIAKKLPEKEDIKYSCLPAEKIVFCMYRGAYQKIAPVYEEMLAWIKEKGYKPSGISYEYYYNDTEFAEEELLTKLVMPIA